MQDPFLPTPQVSDALRETTHLANTVQRFLANGHTSQQTLKLIYKARTLYRTLTQLIQVNSDLTSTMLLVDAQATLDDVIYMLLSHYYRDEQVIAVLDRDPASIAVMTSLLFQFVWHEPDVQQEIHSTMLTNALRNVVWRSWLEKDTSSLLLMRIAYVAKNPVTAKIRLVSNRPADIAAYLYRLTQVGTMAAE